MDNLELLTLLGDTVDVLVHDRRRDRLYLPSGFAGFGATPGVYAFEASTGRSLGAIPTVLRPHDLLLIE